MKHLGKSWGAWWLFAVLLGGAFVPACSCGEEETTTGAQQGTPGAGGMAGGGGTAGAGGDAGAGGTGGSMPTAGKTATDFVNAGEVATSPSYRMVFTLGQSTQNQGVTNSQSYRMQGGVIGATESLP